MNLLIIGNIPPPIGGVSIHIERLLYCLKQDGLPYDWISIKIKSITTLISKYKKSKIIHLHISNVYVRTLLTIISLLTNKKHINTYHGNLGNKSKIENYFDKMSIRLSAYPIVLNENAKDFANKYNHKTRLISAFIPPPFDVNLSEKTKIKIELLKNGYKSIFCTNAFGLKYDVKGKEIYGIIELIDIFSDLKDKGLIISDPNGSYHNYIIKNSIPLSQNIIMISEPHSFIEIIKLSNCYIRNTTTDGDSLSISEGISLNKPVLATNCVQRLDGVILYEVNNRNDLCLKINNLEIENVSTKKYILNSGYIGIKQLYLALLNP